jgi:hypothetical protein
MPERVVNIASEISELAAEKLRQIQRVADSTKTYGAIVQGMAQRG